MSREHIILVGILFAALLIRAVWSLVAAPPPESDFLVFLETARAIGAGAGQPDSYGWSWQGPGYPLAIAPLTLLGASTLPAIYAANTSLGLLTVWLLYQLGAKVFDQRVGLAAAAIGAVYPGLWLWTPLLGAENLSIPILLTIAVLLVPGAPTWRLPVVGVLTCALVFVRPSMLFYVVIVVFTVLALAPSGRKRLAAALFFSSYIVSMLATTTAVQAAGGTGVPVGASGWQAWLVHNERATGAWFPAQDRDDYPFHGMGDRPDLAETVRKGQVKLALQYAVLNPGNIVPGIVERHVGTWWRDDAAIDWTLRRPNAAPAAQSISGPLGALATASFAVALWLALFGLWTRGDRLAITLLLVLPIAYVAAPAAIAEANARYHTNALPFVIVLAAAGLLATSARQRMFALIGAFVVAIWSSVPSLLTPALVAAILAVGAARLLLEGIRILRQQTEAGQARRLAWGFAAGVIIVELAFTLAFVQARQLVLDWSIAQPTQWRVYEGSAGPGTRQPSVRLADLPRSVERVSFQDSTVLPQSTSRGGRIGLARAFPDLAVGEPYVIYLQVSDPPESAPDDISVLANGRPVWRLQPNEESSSGWHDVIVPWRSDTPFLFLQVERVAKTLGGSELLIRNVHLYPRY